MSDSFSLISLPMADQRYAGALFDLVREAGCVDDAEKSLSSFLEILNQDANLKRLVHSPFFSAKEQMGVVCALYDKSGFSDKGCGQFIRNFLRVVAAHRRLSSLSGILCAFRRRVALFRGEFSVQVLSARPLTADQKEELRVVLESVVGGKILLCTSVDPAILGGLIVRLGSHQIDASLMTKLSSLKLALKKEVS